jgi:hypothetical protein
LLLGLSVVLTGRRGLTIPQEGVMLMRGGNTASELAFLARALRSVEFAARVTSPSITFRRTTRSLNNGSFHSLNDTAGAVSESGLIYGLPL